MDMGYRTGEFYLDQHHTTNFYVASQTLMGLVFLDIHKRPDVCDTGKITNEGCGRIHRNKIIMSCK